MCVCVGGCWGVEGGESGLMCCGDNVRRAGWLSTGVSGAPVGYVRKRAALALGLELIISCWSPTVNSSLIFTLLFFVSVIMQENNPLISRGQHWGKVLSL